MTKVYQNNNNFPLNPTNSELDEIENRTIQNVKLSFTGLANVTFKFVQFFNFNGKTKSKFVVILINNCF